MSDHKTRSIIEEILVALDIPDSAYEKAEARYKDLGEWFDRDESICSPFGPHIYPQGSFRLGTVVRPVTGPLEFDLDVGCRLRWGITKYSHTQKQLKELVGADLEAYRKARQIESLLEEKNRCWRLPYKDEVRFHIDAVPSIPEDDATKALLKEAMINAGSAKALVESVTSLAGAITDKRSPDFNKISLYWKISNSEGFALWFESRMKLAMQVLEEHALMAKAAKVDDLPVRRWKSPLQQAIQILKRHRDVMFEEAPDSAPISVIITTLAAMAYQGESDVASALERILNDMHVYVRTTVPRVPNPVNPAEDFGDKWTDPNYAYHHLEKNFWNWLEAARRDFKIVAEGRDVTYLDEQIRAKFAASIDKERLKETLGLASINVVTRPKAHVVSESPAKPWAALEINP
jgi:hypothetical protein